MIYALGDRRPVFLGDSFVADNATIIGSVAFETDTSVWFGAVIRGDNDSITIGKGSNIQESAVLHTDPGIKLIVGPYCTIGHCVMLHGCSVGEGSLIGINSVILNNAVIGKGCLIGANSLISEGKVIPDRSLVVGSPGKVIRELTDDEVARLRWSAENYVQRSKHYKVALKAFDLPSIKGS
jgi:carbonic anhydrase/acetyltransferase-like protein (isoleucine patch superfamily)